MGFRRQLFERYYPDRVAQICGCTPSQIIEVARRHGVRGIAQSSWGPTLCAVTESPVRAEWLAARMADTLGERAAKIFCTPANNFGAKVEVRSSSGN